MKKKLREKEEAANQPKFTSSDQKDPFEVSNYSAMDAPYILRKEA